MTITNVTSVRCLHVDDAEVINDILPIVPTEGLLTDDIIGTRVIVRPLPDNIVIVHQIEPEFSFVHKIAGMDITGEFVIVGMDSMRSPFGLSEDQVRFYTSAIRQGRQKDIGVIPVPGDIANAERLEPGEVLIADIVVTYRKIKLPDECPSCKADLREDRSVAVWSYQDEQDRGRLPIYAGDEDHGYQQLGVVISDQPRNFSGKTSDQNIKNVAFLCVYCSNVLAEGKEDIYNLPTGDEAGTRTNTEKENEHERTEHSVAQDGGPGPG